MEIPEVGLGFWQIAKEDVKNVIFAGLDAGYKHIDTAIAYDNEKEIGDALIEYKAKREELFITSKVPAEIKTYEGAKEAIDKSLERLQIGYLDLMLIHAPKPWAQMHAHLPYPRYDKGNLEVWRALIEAKEAGKIRQIGVSNFSIRDLKNILDNSPEKPYANQIRVHVGHVPQKVIDFCKSQGIIVEAYSPSGTGRLNKNKTVISLAEEYGVSPQRLCVKYDMQKGTVPLPRSKNPAHVKDNFDLNFTIKAEDMATLDKIFAF